jgi:hypothetical protein
MTVHFVVGLITSYVNEHNCQQKPQYVDCSRQSMRLIGSSFDSGVLTLKSIIHGGAMATFEYNYVDIDQVFETEISELDSDIEQLAKRTIDIFNGIRLSISIKTTLECIIDMKVMETFILRSCV